MALLLLLLLLLPALYLVIMCVYLKRSSHTHSYVHVHVHRYNISHLQTRTTERRVLNSAKNRWLKQKFIVFAIRNCERIQLQFRLDGDAFESVALLFWGCTHVSVEGFDAV